RPEPAAARRTGAARSDGRQPGDAADGVGIDDEGLAERPAGLQAVPRQEVEDLPARRDYHSMRTWMTPVEVGASWAKVVFARSRIRPDTKGPRSATRQVTVRPLARSVTRRSVPKGSVR